MHTKLKHLVLGLAFSALAIAGGALQGEPASAPFSHHHAAMPTDTLLAAEVTPCEPSAADRSAAADVGTSHQPPSSDRPWNTEALRASFQMPFFSFGAILPRAPTSLEQ
jgi:hypothetical protein